MTPTVIFNLQLALGYLPWWFCFDAYLWPRLRAMSALDAHRAIAALHSFRFFGLVFLLPGVVGEGLPAGFAAPAAWGDFAAGLLAILALATTRIRPVFWSCVVAFNVVGILDLLVDYANGVRLGLPELSGQLGAAYAIPIVYVPILMITHLAAFRLLARRSGPAAAPVKSAG
jgi:hypothetical protein